jgi:hypothetical protein
MEAAVHVAHDSGHVVAELRARTNLASLTWPENPLRSRALQWDVYELARRVGNRGMSNWALGSLAANHWIGAAEWDRVIVILEEDLEAARGSGDESNLAAILAQFLLSRDEDAPALIALVEGDLESSDPGAVASVHYLHGLISQLHGDAVAATRAFLAAAEHGPLKPFVLPEAIASAMWAREDETVRRLAVELAALPGANAAITRADIAFAGAAIAFADGRRKEALAAFRDVFRRYVELGYDLMAARAATIAARLAGADEPELRPLLAESRQILERVRATAYLRQLDEVVATSGGVPAARAATEVLQRSGG